MRIEGEYNTADVKAESGGEKVLAQIQEGVDSKGLEGDGDIAIMPDFHFGKGATIGFTMPLKRRVIPTTVGVDVGCGMRAARLPGHADLADEDHAEALDRAIRQRVPTGNNHFDRGDYHMYEDFPYSVCQMKLERFNENNGFDIQHTYDTDYYDELLKRVGYSASDASDSVGTLGGGNHFIEIGSDWDAEENPFWVIIHSGSRGLGYKTAKYWMDRATKLRSVKDTRKFFTDLDDQYYRWLSFDPETVSDENLLNWVQGGMGEDFVDYDTLKEDFPEPNREKIGEIRDTLKQALQVADDSDRNTDLDYLEDEEMYGYIIDMIFLQTYAEESRRKMADAVLDAWHEVCVSHRDDVEFVENFESVHNYIDFGDGVIRKGACRAHEDERVIIPFNMKYGTLLCRGKGNPEWNNSAPHGAGRAMSRTKSRQEHTVEQMEEEMNDVYMSVYDTEEPPGAYKDPETIENAIGPSVTIETRVKPLLSIKAD